MSYILLQSDITDSLGTSSEVKIGYFGFMCVVLYNSPSYCRTLHWLVLAYDLLEDKRTTDVIIVKCFSLCLKMGESVKIIF